VTEACLKLTTYSGERHRVAGVLAADALLGLYGRRRVRLSVLLRGIEGYGPRRHLRTDRLLSLSEDLPIVSVAVDTEPRIRALVAELHGLGHLGLLTLERAQLLDAGPVAPTAVGQLGEEIKLTVYVGRQERIENRPAFVAICELLRARGLAGATVLLGVDGTMHGERRRAHFVAANRAVPMMIVAVGGRERIEAVLPELQRALPEPLLTLERVRVCRRDGVALSDPSPVPDRDPSGLPVWCKLMVYSSEQARHGGSPLHVSLVRSLAARGVRGATCVRGIWGFHGDHAPHGDRLFALRRRVPVVTILVEAPERIATAFAIVDEHTREQGLVTSEVVPALATLDAGRAPASLELARPGDQPPQRDTRS
jgi:PII-like signaling protein